MSAAIERKAAEQEYANTAFDYGRDPIGSRDWCIFWKGWQARAAIPPSTAPQMTPAMRSIGATMSNIMFNLGQHATRTFSDYDACTFRDLAKQWDTAVSGVPPSTGVAAGQAQQGLVIPPSRAEPAVQRGAIGAALAEFVALDDLRAWLAEKDYADHTWWWKEKKLDYDRRSAAVWNSARAAIAAVEQSSIAGAAKGGNTSEESGNSSTPKTAPSQAKEKP